MGLQRTLSATRTAIVLIGVAAFVIVYTRR